MPTALAPLKRLRTTVTALALVAGTVAVGATVTPEANAQAGRRICAYTVKMQGPQGNNPLLRYSIGLDYKKSGVCPPIDGFKFGLMHPTLPHGADIATGVRKWTCEDWARAHNLDSIGISDPCPDMTNDDVYLFTWQSPTNPLHQPPRMDSLGPVWQFQS